MDISVIGCGRWGSFIAWYLNRIGHKTTLYGRKTSKNMQTFIETRKNAYVTLPDEVELTTNLEKALRNEIIIISIASQSLRSLSEQLANANAQNKLYVLCMKGIEIETGNRLTQVMAQTLGENCRTAVWLGPGHVQEFTRNVPNCMVIDSENHNDKLMLVHEFSSDLIRFYYGSDLIGSEIGAAAKNVVGIAAGMLDGHGLASLKGALMSRGTYEVSRLIEALGGNKNSAYGLCHLGDYEATVFSPHSHNRMFGELFVRGEKHESLAEGVYTVRALANLAKQHEVDIPISTAVYKILYENVPAREAINGLFSRSIKFEFT